MKKRYKRIFRNLTKNLTGVKKAKLKRIIIKILIKWMIEIRRNRDNFVTAFLSKEADKYFKEIKERVGEFKDISKMSVLEFLERVILGLNLEEKDLEVEDEFFKELHKEFSKKREEMWKIKD